MLSHFYYAVFICLGTVISVEDWSHKKISNRWIVIGMLAGASGCLYLFWSSILGHQHLRWWRIGEYYYPWRFFLKIGVHLFLSFAASYTLWRMSIWPAGDAKLFTLFAFLLAIIDPNLPGFPLLLFMLLLVNIFLPAALFFAAETVFVVLARMPRLQRIELGPWLRGRLDAARIRLNEAWPYRWNYAMIVVNTFALFYAMQIFQARVGRLPLGPFGQVLVFLSMLVTWRRLSCLLRNKVVGLFALLGISAGTLAGAFLGHWDIGSRIAMALKMTVNFGMFLSLARGIFYWAIEKDSLRELAAERLEAGVVLSDEAWQKVDAEKDLQGRLGARYSDGLSHEDARVLQDWMSRPGLKSFTAYHTVPFAIWIFIGSLYTLQERKNLLVDLAPYFVRAEAILKAGLGWWLS